MRRLLSILLMAVLGLPLVSPLMARGADGDGALPVCCRRSGVHHCMGAMPTLRGTTVGAVQAKCPYCPGALVSVHAGGMLVGRAGVASAGFAEARVRVGRAASRRYRFQGKACLQRGPPGLSLL